MDPSKLKAQFVNFEIKSKHVEYIIRVKYDEEKWLKNARYSDLYDLHKEIKVLNGSMPSFPPKTMFNSLKPKFLSQRQKALEHYCTTLLERPDKYNAKPLIDFLCEDHPIAVDQSKQQFRASNVSEKTDNKAPDAFEEIYKEYYSKRLLQVPKSSNNLFIEEDDYLENKLPNRVALEQEKYLGALKSKIFEQSREGTVDVASIRSPLDDLVSGAVQSLNQIINIKYKPLGRDREFITDIKQYK